MNNYSNSNGNGRRLTRSRHNRMITGVCAGVGEHFGVNPWLIRLLYIALVPALGSGILIYILCTVLIPEESF